MSAIVSFECPHCGAPLQLPLGALTVRCEYCGNSVVVPAELRPAPPPPAAGDDQRAAHSAAGRACAGVAAGPHATALHAASRSPRWLRCPMVMLVVVLLFAGAAYSFVQTRSPYFFDNLIAGGYARLDQTFDAQVDGTNLLQSPMDIALDNKDNIYVLDDVRQVVARFDRPATM